jgi:hypothetical protein
MEKSKFLKISPIPEIENIPQSGPKWNKDRSFILFSFTLLGITEFSRSLSFGFNQNV